MAERESPECLPGWLPYLPHRLQKCLSRVRLQGCVPRERRICLCHWWQLTLCLGFQAVAQAGIPGILWIDSGRKSITWERWSSPRIVPLFQGSWLSYLPVISCLNTHFLRCFLVRGSFLFFSQKFKGVSVSKKFFIGRGRRLNFITKFNYKVPSFYLAARIVNEI